MENWQRAGFGNEHIFRVARTENAAAFLNAAITSLREAGFPRAARSVGRALFTVGEAVRQARMEAKEAGYPLNEGWPEGGEKLQSE